MPDQLILQLLCLKFASQHLIFLQNIILRSFVLLNVRHIEREGVDPYFELASLLLEGRIFSLQL